MAARVQTVKRRTPHLFLREVHSASVAGAHAQLCHPQVGPQTRLEPWGPVVNILHVHRDGGYRREEGFVGGRAIERVLERVSQLRGTTEAAAPTLIYS